MVEEALEGLDEEGAALKAAFRVASRLRGLDEVTFRRRVASYLKRRGFGAAVVATTLREVAQDLADR